MLHWWRFSKLKGPVLLHQAYDAGQRDFGENYVQELLEKHEQLPVDIRWHFIGHLQGNKVKYIAPFVYLIHGVDSLKLLMEINKQALKNNRVISCLLQLHIATEETKFGFSLNECHTLFKSGELLQLENVDVVGLMAMASNTNNVAQIKNEYRLVYELWQQLEAEGTHLQILSYGMSGDYKTAIACGSNMVRIGSSIFGERGT